MQQAMLFPMTVVSPRGLPENSANVYREMAMARQKVTFKDVLEYNLSNSTGQNFRNNSVQSLKSCCTSRKLFGN